jgi:16S rRNA (guanine1516-N2)-methyltransferase
VSRPDPTPTTSPPKPGLPALRVEAGADPALLADVAGLRLPEAANSSAALLLCVTPTLLELREAGGRRAVHCELTGGPAGARLRRAGLRKEALARAVGLGSGTRTVVDATAGLGGDSALLAWLGAQVTAVERQPVVAALLRDGLRRAVANPRFGALAGRVSVVVADARDVLRGAASDPPDAVLIDPMFPSGRTALGRGELQLLRRLVGEDTDADELLAVALAVARRRVVVKRPARAAPLAGRAPHQSSRGSSTRFDVYFIGRAS